jgi:hypothetical protein
MGTALLAGGGGLLAGAVLTEGFEHEHREEREEEQGYDQGFIDGQDDGGFGGGW